MAAKGLNMKVIDEIFRLKALGFGKRKISRTLGLHRNTVSKYFDPPVAEEVAAATSATAEATEYIVEPSRWQALIF